MHMKTAPVGEKAVLRGTVGLYGAGRVIESAAGL